MSTKPDNLLDVIFAVRQQLNYEIDEDGIVTIVEKQNHPIQRFFRKFKVRIPENRKISMDAYGSFVFCQINGRRTVREIGEALRAEFGDQVDPLYDRLSLFLEQIEKRCDYIQRVNP